MSRAFSDNIRAAILTVGGSGYAPFASGSWGSLAAVLLFVGVWVGARKLGLSPLMFDALVNLPGILLATVFGITWGPWAIERWGRKDPKPFVLDEFAGQWIALLVLPAFAYSSLWGAACVIGGQFFFFRLFDVLKPPPASHIDAHWPNGWGITCDDLVAGAYALIVGQLIWRFTPAATWLGIAASGS